MIDIKPSRRKVLLFYLILFLPILLIFSFLIYLFRFTSLPQELYSETIQNIYFDCLSIAAAPYVYKAKPGECLLNNLEYNTVLSHDSYGFRNPDDIDIEAEVVLLGDSHAHGFGVEDDQTYSAILSREFGFATRNMGIGSYATSRELEVLKAYSNGKEIVVIQYCNNDFGENLAALTLTRTEFENEVADRWREIREFYYQGKSQGFLNPLRGFARKLLRKDFQSKQKFYEAYKIRDIGSEAEQFAKILDRYKATLSGREIIIFESSEWGINHPDFKSVFESAINQYASELDVTVLDSTNFLDYKDYYFFDDHLNGSGHQKIATVLNETIQQL